jgi:hypothetical protein
MKISSSAGNRGDTDRSMGYVHDLGGGFASVVRLSWPRPEASSSHSPAQIKTPPGGPKGLRSRIELGPEPFQERLLDQVVLSRERVSAVA